MTAAEAEAKFGKFWFGVEFDMPNGTQHVVMRKPTKKFADEAVKLLEAGEKQDAKLTLVVNSCETHSVDELQEIFDTYYPALNTLFEGTSELLSLGMRVTKKKPD
jgi:hypothetical protein